MEEGEEAVKVVAVEAPVPVIAARSVESGRAMGTETAKGSVTVRTTAHPTAAAVTKVLEEVRGLRVPEDLRSAGNPEPV